MRRRVALLLLACAALPALADRSYAPGPFDGVEISGAADIEFRQGAVDEVLVVGDDAVQQRVELTLSGTLLRIDSAGSWRFWSDSKTRLVVTARRLTRLVISGAATVQAPAAVRAERLAISISGAGSARFDRLQAERLDFVVSGSGDAACAGQVGDLRVAVSGRGDFQGENLASRRATVAISGLGDIKVWALETLSIAVSGIGRVEYWGQPSVRRSIGGSATVLDRGPKPAP